LNNAARRSTEGQSIGREILEHFRNLLFSATLLGLGLVARRRSADLFGAPMFEAVIGCGIIAVAAVLALINLWLGVSRLKQWKHWRLWSVLLLAVYAAIALRIVEVMAMVQEARRG
jgi:hypothetical protein